MDEPQPNQETKNPVVEPGHSSPRLYVNPSKTFAALKFPNYRLWFIGQLASLVGTWMQSTAQGYLVYQLTGSPAYLGYVGFANGIPFWIFSLIGGVVSDRISRRKLLIITQSVAMMLAFILATLVFTELVQPWHIIVLAFLLGVNNAFDAPARQSFISEMVTRETMGNGIALNASMFNLATAVGPAIAGLAYATLGPAWCFMINGISYLAVIMALAMMRFKPFVAPKRTQSTWSDVKEGLSYVLHNKTILLIIGMLGVTSLFGMSYVTLIPAWAVDVLKGDATTNGLLQSVRGIGALVASLMIASLGTTARRGRLLTIGSFLFPALVIVFSFIRSVPLALVILLGVGWAFMIFINLANNLVQHIVPDQLRGRVMSIYALIFMGMMPIGSMLAGLLAEAFGTPLAVLASASVALMFAIILFVGAPFIRKLH